MCQNFFESVSQGCRKRAASEKFHLDILFCFPCGYKKKKKKKLFVESFIYLVREYLRRAVIKSSLLEYSEREKTCYGCLSFLIVGNSTFTSSLNCNFYAYINYH